MIILVIPLVTSRLVAPAVLVAVRTPVGLLVTLPETPLCVGTEVSASLVNLKPELVTLIYRAPVLWLTPFLVTVPLINALTWEVRLLPLPRLQVERCVAVVVRLARKPWTEVLPLVTMARVLSSDPRTLSHPGLTVVSLETCVTMLPILLLPTFSEVVTVLHLKFRAPPLPVTLPLALARAGLTFPKGPPFVSIWSTSLRTVVALANFLTLLRIPW